MKKIVLILGISFLILGSLTGWTLYQGNNSKIAVIDSKNVLESYQGFKDAQDIFEKKSHEYDASLKIQTDLYKKRKSEIEENRANWNNEKIVQEENELKILYQTVSSLNQNIESKKKEEEAQLLEGIYNQVDSFIEDYCKEKNIAVVLGANGTGNVVYNSENIDKTEEVIVMLNKKYRNDAP